MEITASMVKELRETTGAGMMDCKKALSECDGSMDAAIDWLREKGFAKATKKGARIAAEGLASIYIAGNRAIILEVNSETDFVSKNDEFKEMIDNIGNTLLKSDAKTVEEALEVKFEDGTINDLIVAKTAKIGEKLSLRRFEILEKTEEENFGSYLHMGGKIASLALVKNASEEVARDVAMQSAAMKAQYLDETKVPAEVVEREKEIFKQQAIEEGKKPEFLDKIIEGKVKKFYKEICLVDQAFIKDGDVDVKTYVANNGGEIVNCIRYEVGEGMEKRNDNFAEEVMNQVNA